MKYLVAACLMLAGCAGKHYSVCLTPKDDPTAYCRTGYRKTDARIAAETLDLLPFVDHAWPAKTKDVKKVARPVNEHGKPL